jgi:hypothetical protein
VVLENAEPHVRVARELAQDVTAPGVFTAASTSERNVVSRSVAVSDRRSSFASRRTFVRI